jgi:WD40 repeat protein
MRSGIVAPLGAVTALTCLTALFVAAGVVSDRVAAPDAASRTKATEQLKERYKDEWAKAEKDPVARLALAELLLEKARPLPAADPLRFVSLRAAADLAARAVNVPVALLAVEELSRTYTVDVTALRIEAIGRAVDVVRDPQAAHDLVDLALAFASEAVEEDRHDQAAGLARVAERAARKAKDLPLVVSVQRFERGVAASRTQYQRLRPFVERLQKDPTDPEANLQLGKYQALLKGDWDRGLFLLAQGSDPDLRRLAQRDLCRPETNAEQVETGDAWWQHADKVDDQAKVHLRQRAVHWYELALTAAEDNVRERLEERVAAVPRPPARVAGWDYAGPARELRVLRGENNAPFAVAFAPDGRLVVSGGVDSRAYLWDAGTGQQLRVLQGHGNVIGGAAFDPTGRTVLTASWDGTVKVWETRTGKELRRLPAQGRFADFHSMALSADGKRLATGGDDGIVRIWELSTGKVLLQMRGHGGSISALAFSPDGREVLSGGQVDNTLILWGQKGQIVRRMQGSGSTIRSVAFTPDGKKAVAPGGNDVVLWDLKTGGKVRALHGHSQVVHGVAVSPNGKRVLSGSADGTVRLWDLDTGREVHRFTGHNAAVFCVAFSPGGGRALSGGQDNTVRVWGLPR